MAPLSLRTRDGSSFNRLLRRLQVGIPLRLQLFSEVYRSRFHLQLFSMVYRSKFRCFHSISMSLTGLSSAGFTAFLSCLQVCIMLLLQLFSMVYRSNFRCFCSISTSLTGLSSAHFTAFPRCLQEYLQLLLQLFVSVS
jgi:hypothetical protein